MYRNKKWGMLIALLGCLLLSSGCLIKVNRDSKETSLGKENTESSQTSKQVEVAVIDSMKQFDLEEKYEYDPTVYHLKHDEIIEFKAKKYISRDRDKLFKVSPLHPHKDWKGVSPIQVFTDVTLKSPLDHGVWYEHRDHKITLTPDGTLSAINWDSKVGDDYQHLQLIGESNWGSFHTVYVVIYNDLMTGEVREKPLVQTYQIDQTENLPAPIVNYSISDTGELKLSWTAVEKARKYYVVSMEYSNDPGKDEKYHLFPKVIAETTDTTWGSYPESLDESKIRYVNESFKSRVNKDDDNLYRDLEENFTGKLERVKNFDPSTIHIIAANEQQQSALSNAIGIRDLGDKLPTRIAVYTMIGESGSYSLFNSLDDLPPYVPVLMTGGAVRFSPYKILEDRMKQLNNGSWMLYYQVKGTPFVDFFRIATDEPNFKEKVLQLNHKIEKMQRQVACRP